jgi:hypothetical protein
VSKAGQADIRRLLIIGAMSRLTGSGGNPFSTDPGSPFGGTEAENARRNSAGEPDGASDLGNADTQGGLSGSGTGDYRMIFQR